MLIRSPTVITSRVRASGASSSSKVPGCHGMRSLSSASGSVEGEMPRRSLFCASAPTGLVHWYQPRLGGAHLRPHVRTRRSTERGGGRDSGKSAQLAMFGVTARGHLKSGQTAHSHRSGQVSPAIAHVCTGRSLQCGRVRGARASKTRRGGVNQRTVEFLGGQTRFFGFPVCYLGRNHRTTHLPGEKRLRSRVEKTEP